MCHRQTGNMNQQYYVRPCSGMDVRIIVHFCISEALKLTFENVLTE
jgi:hypothetical protein